MGIAHDHSFCVSEVYSSRRGSPAERESGNGFGCMYDTSYGEVNPRFTTVGLHGIEEKGRNGALLCSVLFFASCSYFDGHVCEDRICAHVMCACTMYECCASSHPQLPSTSWATVHRYCNQGSYGPIRRLSFGLDGGRCVYAQKGFCDENAMLVCCMVMVEQGPMRGHLNL